MDTQHLNAMHDFMEELGSPEPSINDFFDMHIAHNQKITMLKFEIDLKNTLIDRLSEQVLQLIGAQNKS